VALGEGSVKAVDWVERRFQSPCLVALMRQHPAGGAEPVVCCHLVSLCGQLWPLPDVGHDHVIP